MIVIIIAVSKLIFAIRTLTKFSALNSVLKAFTVLLLAIRLVAVTPSPVSNGLVTHLIRFDFSLEGVRVPVHYLFDGLLSFRLMLFVIPTFCTVAASLAHFAHCKTLTVEFETLRFLTITAVLVLTLIPSRSCLAYNGLMDSCGEGIF